VVRFFSAIADAFLWLVASRKGWYVLSMLALAGVDERALVLLPLVLLAP
jgi:hypothetical protein